jgi:hypothetical protein
VLDPAHDGWRDALIDRNRLMEIVENACSALSPWVGHGVDPVREFFVHNDAAPGNMFFPGVPQGHKGRALLFDFEYAGATRYPVLAWLTDLANFYGRCWPNPVMQRVFLQTLLGDDRVRERIAPRDLAKATAVFGTVSLARFAMQTDHPEHPMAVALMTHLEHHIAFVDERSGATGGRAECPVHPPSRCPVSGHEKTPRGEPARLVSG